MAADPDRSAERQDVLALQRLAVNPHPPGGTDRLNVPLVAPAAKHQLNVGDEGFAQSNLAIRPAADASGRAAQLDHPFRRTLAALNQNISCGFRHLGRTPP